MAERSDPDPRGFYKNAAIGLCCFGVDLRFLDVNDWLAGVSGLSVADHMGKTAADVWPEIAPGVEGALRQVIATGEPVLDRRFTLENSTHYPNAKTTYKHNYAPVRAADGSIAGVSAVIEDITDRSHPAAGRGQQETWMQTFLEQTTDWLWEMDENQKYTYLSDKYYQLTGDAADAVIGKTSVELGRIYESQEAFAEVDQAMANQQPFWDVVSWRKVQGGRDWWTQSSGTPVFDGQGRFCGYRGISRDITESKQREDELRATTNLLHTILENMPAGISYRGSDGKIVFMNSYAADRLGSKPEDFIGKTLLEVLGSERKAITEEQAYRVIASGQPIRNYTYHSKLQPEHEFLSNSIPVHDDDGQLIGVISIAQDITEIRKTESDLERLSKVLENIPDVVTIFGPDDRIIYANRSLFPEMGDDDIKSSIGTPYAEVIQNIVDEGLVLDAIGREEAWLEERLASHRESRGPHKMHLQNGATFLMYRHRLDDGSTFTIGHDITDAEAALDALHESETRYQDLVEGSLQGIVVHRDLVPLYANDAIAEMFGYDNPEDFLQAGSIGSFADADDARRVESRATQRSAGEEISKLAEFRGIRKDGEQIWFMTSGRTIQWQGEAAIQATVIDITEIKKLESQLLQAQKMEAIGHLTGGIAHDFNNLLGIMKGNLELLQRRVPMNDQSTDYLGEALDAVERAAALTHRLLAFASRQPLQPRPSDIAGIIGGMEDLLRRTISENIALEVVLDSDTGSVLIDPQQLENAILNLVLNARDSMTSGGRLYLKTSVEVIDGAEGQLESPIEAGTYRVISVSDSGSGMSEADLQQAFDPFFTTKPFGVGSGLGLSMVHGFVKQSGGYVRMESQLGVGTIVRLYLPLAAPLGTPPADAEELPAHTTPAQDAQIGRGRTVLVVEDDADLRHVAIEVLEDLGFTVLEAGDGEAAAAILESQADLDLLFTDLVLPGSIGGLELVDLAQVKYTDAMILMCSGYAQGTIETDRMDETGLDFISKPYGINELALAVERVLLNG